MMPLEELSCAGTGITCRKQDQFLHQLNLIPKSAEFNS